MLSPNVKNLTFAKAGVFFKRKGTAGFLHLGETEKCEIKTEVTNFEYYTNLLDTRQLAGEWITEKKAIGALELMEYTPENLQMAAFCTAINSSSQLAGTFDGESVTTVADLYVSTGKIGGLSYKKISIGTVTGGPFEAGETITGGTSTETAKVIAVQTGYLLVIADSGITSGETITGGTSSASAAVTGITTITGAIVADAATAATITSIYTAGTDYNFDAQGGIIRELAGGSIAAHTVYLYCDIPAVTKKAMYALSGDAVEGQLMIVGTTKEGYGTRMQYQTLDNDKCRLTCTSGIQFITQEPQPLAFDIKILSDVNYPDSPFGTLTVLE